MMMTTVTGHTAYSLGFKQPNPTYDIALPDILDEPGAPALKS